MLVAGMLLSACGGSAPATNATDSPDAVSTQVEQTVQARLTAVPSAAATLPASVPTALPASTKPGAQCTDAATFVTDVTIPDETVMTPSQAFTKTWRVKNSGTCIWTTAYTYALEEGPGNEVWTDAPHPLTAAVEPGQSVDISVNLTAPAFSRGFTAYYQLYNAAGTPFLNFTAVIKVQNGNAAAGFAVTNVAYVVSTWSDTIVDKTGYGTQYTDCPLVTANITANGAGTVKYHWVGFPSQNPSVVSDLSGVGAGYFGSLTFDSAGVKSVSQRWTYRESSGGMAMMSVGDSGGIFIDIPNNQAFGGIFLPVCSAP